MQQMRQYLTAVAARREVVRELQGLGLSERQALRLVGMSASTLCYQPSDDGDGRLRERLSQHWFASLSHMRSVIDNWREDYNHHRPHSTLGYVPPAVFAARCCQLAGSNA